MKYNKISKRFIIDKNIKNKKIKIPASEIIRILKKRNDLFLANYLSHFNSK